LLKPLQATLLTCLRKIRDTARYTRTDGTEVPIDLGLVDAGWEKDIVYHFCQESGPKWRPTYGRGKGAGLKAFTRPKPGEQTRVAANWYAQIQPADRQWVWFLNADYWKQYVHDGLRQVVGSEGGLTLFGGDPRDHRTFGKHLTAETWNPEKDQWVKVSDSNHLFDSTYMSLCALDMLGIKRVKRELVTVTGAGPSKAVQTHGRVAGIAGGGWSRRGGGWMKR
jgi:hypothetical protein